MTHVLRMSRSFTIFLVLGSFVCTSVVKSSQIEDDHVCQVFEKEVLCKSTTTSIRLPCIRECNRYKENCQSARVYGNDRQCRIQLKTITCDRVVGNIQQKTWTNWTTGSQGQVLSVDYMKKKASTSLRVRWAGNMRGGRYANSGSRFYFTFNGAPCTEPADIEAIDWTGADRLYRQHIEFEGLCNNIPAGPIQIGFNVGTLPGISSQPFLGRSHGNSKITAEEVDLGENIGMCPNHTVFNVKQHTFATADTASGIYSASVFRYTKLAPDTSLRVRWFGALGAKSQSPEPGCLRFYFTFNGEECKTPTPIDGAIAWLTDPIIRTQTTHSIEGICQNLGQGDYAVALNVGHCLYGNLSQMDPDPGVNDVSRIIVEEVRLGMSQFAEQAVLLTCSFESNSICGFTQSTNDDFNWSRRSGGTSTANTGPSSACSGSYYMYIETSLPRVLGDTAVLYTPSLSLAGGCGRLVFRFHAYGNTLGYLRVKLYNGQHMAQQLWAYSGYSKNTWQETSVYFEQGGNFQIAFEGVRGRNFGGDFAIDVVTVSTVSSSYCNSPNRDQPPIAEQVFNLRHWNWYNLNYTGLGEIESMIYPKMSCTSGLRVSMTATVMTSQRRDLCAQWQFRFDGHVCPLSTHAVEGLRYTYSDQITTQHLFPITVSGICTGLPAKNLVLSIHTTSCGGSPVDAVTGWQTSFFVSAEEVVLP